MQCAKCGNPAVSKCASCEVVWYCSRQCQVGDWVVHKGPCSKSRLSITRRILGQIGGNIHQFHWGNGSGATTISLPENLANFGGGELHFAYLSHEHDARNKLNFVFADTSAEMPAAASPQDFVAVEPNTSFVSFVL